MQLEFPTVHDHLVAKFEALLDECYLIPSITHKPSIIWTSSFYSKGENSSKKPSKQNFKNASNKTKPVGEWSGQTEWLFSVPLSTPISGNYAGYLPTKVLHTRAQSG